MGSPPELPSGTVTFLFTDIEGSTRLLKQLRGGYAAVLSEHHELLAAAFAAKGGQVVDTQGDSFFVVFRRAQDAVAAAIAAQRALQAHAWPDGIEVRVRMGIHTGQAEASGGRYHGLAVHRAARIGATAHGGQVLVSDTTRNLLEDEEDTTGVSLRDLGEQRLKDLDRPVRLYQLVSDGLAGEFPALRTAEPSPAEPPAGARRRLRVAAPIAALVAAGAVAAGVFLTRGDSGSAQAARVAADSVGVFDVHKGNLIAAAPVRPGPTAVAIGADSVWVANVDSDSVSQIDPHTNQSVETIPVGNAPSGIAFGGDFVWVTNSLGRTVSKIDPRTQSVVQTIPVGNGPLGIAYGERAVWVANSTDRTVTRIDPRAGTPGEPIPVAAGADGVAVGHHAVWVTSESGGILSRIDPRTTIVTPINVGRGASAVAFGAGSVWVANGQDDTVSRVDPGTNSVTALITVDDGPSGVAVSPDGRTIWVSSEFAGSLSQIDPHRDKVVRKVTTGNRPQDVAMDDKTLYAAVRTSGRAHRGGTLTVLTAPQTFDSIDPAVAYTNASWSTLILTNDGLVAFKRVGGSNGTRLVPDLATTIPVPTDAGRTYTFQVRRGIHYSTGALVRPADFRRAIERSVAAFTGKGAGAGYYYSAIQGYGQCVEAPQHCDLSRGIVTDSVSNTVTFHLASPDPDFLQQLALPQAFAVPASTPRTNARLPLPATGPYMIASYDAKRGLRLVRNPRFREWYEAAQPRGNPDAIVWRFDVLPSAQRRAVREGKADVARDAGEADQGMFPPASLLTELQTRYASQLHIDQTITTAYVFLNTRLPPFDDVKVRQAFNYAVDRDRFAALHGGLSVRTPTCQMLPPNINGYRRYCPYTLRPSADGTYAGPDIARAQELVEESGTKGQEITFAGPPLFRPHGGDYLVSVLQSLGYRVRYRATFDVADSRRKIQAGIYGWTQDYPTAGSFLSPLLTCDSFIPDSDANPNLAEFCNHGIDADIARARALEVADPGAASRLWTKIDRAVVQQAPHVSLDNPLQVTLVSRRVGNYQYNPQWRVLLDQLWVR